jgi:hypothetical protein
VPFAVVLCGAGTAGHCEHLLLLLLLQLLLFLLLLFLLLLWLRQLLGVLLYCWMLLICTSLRNQFVASRPPTVCEDPCLGHCQHATLSNPSTACELSVAEWPMIESRFTNVLSCSELVGPGNCREVIQYRLSSFHQSPCLVIWSNDGLMKEVGNWAHLVSTEAAVTSDCT